MAAHQHSAFYEQDSKAACIAFHDLRFGATLRGRDAKIWLAGDGKGAATQEHGACRGVSCTKPILKGLTGVFRPGKMTAIMGVSLSSDPELLLSVLATGVRL